MARARPGGLILSPVLLVSRRYPILGIQSCFGLLPLHAGVVHMASSSSDGLAGAGQNPRKSLGFMANAKKNKHNFIQLFAMTGILLLSVRSLGQKYRIHDLEEDTSALREENEGLTHRLNNIKRGLLHEASLDPTGKFASRLSLLFRD